MSGPDIELEQLEAALRAESAEPSPAFAAALDRRVEEGFPKPARRGRLSLPSLWPALAAATVLVVVAVVALSVLGGGGRSTTTSSALRAQPAPLPAAARDSALSLSPQTLSSANAAGGRRVERDVQLTIGAARDKLQQAANGIGTVAQSHGGFVLSSHVTTGDTGTSGGTFELRVPQRELEATIADLSKLGHLHSRSENGQDVTAPYNHVQDRLGNALVERRTLKLRLRHAQGAKADAIRVRIATLNGAIDTLNRRLKNLRSRTVYSMIGVTLEQAKSGAGGTGAAFDDARRILQGMLNFCVRALAVLLPLALLVALAALGTRVMRKRRREAALM
ncbi:MAG: hypothetical protein QOI19_2103 [Thermoleophilaceae bacterium]|jgi:hypothetical protein|nr:hypothetical protein [Thermoleophilaceae bacterium]